MTDETQGDFIITGYRRFIRIDEVGTIQESLLTSLIPLFSDGGDWRLVDSEQDHMLNWGLDRIRWCMDDNMLKEKVRVRLSVGMFTFPADGVTEVAVGIRPYQGVELPPDTKVNLDINGESIEVTPYEDLTISTSEPGVYRVRISDKYHFAVPAEELITAEEVVEEEEPSDE